MFSSARGVELDLRTDLLPPKLDEAVVARLAALASRLDGISGAYESELAEFNALAGTALSIGEFQGIYGVEDHEDWVRGILYSRLLMQTTLTREEMKEIVSRTRPSPENPDWKFYLKLFFVNCRHPSGSDLLFWPQLVPELPKGREPTVDEIADLALIGGARSATQREP
jgi:hypothetical protein